MERLESRAGPWVLTAALLVIALGAVPPPSAAQNADAAGAGKAMSDGQIVAVVLSAAATAISQAELALARSSHPEVRTLARELVADNTLLDQNTLHLLASLGIQPTESAESDRLVETTTGSTDELAGLRGSRFDRAYVTREVAEHRDLLARLDGILIPEAESHEVRRFLATVRPVVEIHLKHAETVAARLPA
jgi:predicted outer membrane protein